MRILTLYKSMKIYQIFSILLFVAFFSFPSFAQIESTVSIVPMQIIEREINLQETHIYKFSLNAGEFVRFAVEQKNVDPQLIINDAKGVSVRQMYFEKIVGKTAISFIADKKASFLLSIKPSGKSEMNGNYRLQMSKPRLSNEVDRQKIEAEKILSSESSIRRRENLAGKPTLEQRRERLATLQKLAEDWQKLSEPIFEQATWRQIGILALGLRNQELAKTAFEKLLSLARTNSDILDETCALYYLGNLATRRGRTRNGGEKFDDGD